MKNRSILEESFELKGWQNQDQSQNNRGSTMKEIKEIRKEKEKEKEKVKKYEKMIPNKNIKALRLQKLSSFINSDHIQQSSKQKTAYNMAPLSRQLTSLAEEIKSPSTHNNDILAMSQEFTYKSEIYESNMTKININQQKMKKKWKIENQQKQNEKLKYFTIDLELVRNKKKNFHINHIKNKCNILYNRSHMKTNELPGQSMQNQHYFLQNNRKNKKMTKRQLEYNTKINKMYEKIRLKNKYLKQLKSQTKKFHNFPLFYRQSQIKKEEKVRESIMNRKSKHKSSINLIVCKQPIKSKQFIDDSIFSNKFLY